MSRIVLGLPLSPKDELRKRLVNQLHLAILTEVMHEQKFEVKPIEKKKIRSVKVEEIGNGEL